jgi:glycosyltransferase involved in cell wall biosynthesis
MNDSIKLSVIMPALNEENDIAMAVGNVLHAFDDCGIDGQIIVVDDGSIDKTGEIVENLRKEDDRILLVRHEKPEGIGAAFWEGVDCSANDVVTMIPGDNENDPWETLRYFKLLDHVDIVIPFSYNRAVRSIWRNFLSYTFRFIINTSFQVNFNYTNGTVLYKRSVLKDLENRSSGFFFQTDILIRAVKKGYLFAEVPYRLGLRGSGDSKAISFPSLIQVIKGYLRLLKGHYSSSKVKESGQFLEGTSTAKRYGYENKDYRT